MDPPTSDGRLRILVGPAHWSGLSHHFQLRAVACALAARGHEVHYLESAQHALSSVSTSPDGLTTHVLHGVEWPRGLDVELALRTVRDNEPTWKVQVDLVLASCDAAAAFFALPMTKALLQLELDIAVVDAGCLAGALLADWLRLPYVHFLSYPYHPPNAKTALLESSHVQKRLGARLQALRASLALPPKSECAALHMLTVIGHSRALHVQPSAINENAPPRPLALPARMHCVGSVVQHAEWVMPLAEELAAWADAAPPPGFVVVSFGSWAGEVVTKLGLASTLAAALAQLGLPVLWKRAGHENRRTAGHAAEGKASRTDNRATSHPTADEDGWPPCIRTASWIPQRALLAHPRCALLVCHGGANSLTEACEAAVPIVGLPLCFDQPANLAALEQLGVALTVSPKACDAASLVAAMRTVLARDGAFRARAEALAAAMRAVDEGASGAVRVVEAASARWRSERL